MFIYESHLGGIYYSDKELGYDERYCEACGDSDTYWGQADTLKEAMELLEPIINKKYTNYEGCHLCGIYESICDEFCDGTFETGGYDEEFVLECLAGMEVEE